MRRLGNRKAWTRGVLALAVGFSGVRAVTESVRAVGLPPYAGVPIFQSFINQPVVGSVASFGWKVPPRNEPGATFEFLSNTASNGGVIVGQSNGSFVYTPQTDNCGIGFIPFRVTNPDGQSDTGSLEVLNTPDAIDDAFSTPAGTALTANVGTNDTVGYRPSVQWYRNPYTANPSHGTVTMSPQGTVNNAQFTYTPAAGYQGYDSFEYWVECGGKTDAATVTVAIGNAGPPTSATTTLAATTSSTLPAATCNGPQWPTVEAECAVLAGTIAVESNAGASGGKEIGGWDYSGTATLTLTAPAAGTYDIKIRGNAPYGPAQRTFRLNGVSTAFTLPTAARSLVTIPGVSLQAGANTFVLSRAAGNDNVANVDLVTAEAGTATTPPTTPPATPPTTPPTTPPAPVGCGVSTWPSVEAECAALTGTIAVENHAGASGGKELGGWDYTGSASLTMTAPTAGVYDFIVRSNAPYGTATRTIIVNGTARTFTVLSAARQDLLISGVTLKAGANAIVFARWPTNDGVVNLDKISAVSGDPNATTVAPPTTAPATSSTTAPGNACAGPKWPVFEAECAVLGGSIFVENHAGASNGKELGGWDYAGTATFNATAPAAGSYHLEISVYAPYGAATRTLSINGVSQTLVIPAGRTVVVTSLVSLKLGANTVVFSRGANNDNVVNLDKVSFTP
jgi:hypothetical protein